MMVWKIIFLFQGRILRCHISFRGVFENGFYWIRPYYIILATNFWASVFCKILSDGVVFVVQTYLGFSQQPQLGGGFKCFLCSPLFGEDTQFD